MKDLAGRLTADGHELAQRVYFEDTDFSGRVYHARYLHFLERGRSDYLRLLGVHHGELAEQGLAFAVSRMTLRFLAPAGIDDVLRIVTLRQKVGGARIVLDQTIYREEQSAVSAEVSVALVDRAGKPVRLPVSVRTALR